MKCYCLLFCVLSDLYDKIYKLIVGTDFKSICHKIFDFLSMGNKELTLELIGYEVTLITLYFVFLPLIIENKDKEIYLGHKVSKWILYERNKKNKISRLWTKIIKKQNVLSDMCISWNNNICLILFSVILYIFKLNFVVIILFIIFTICIGIKVSDYLMLTSSDSYKREIEKNFLDLCINNNDKICNMFKNNTINNILENKQTLAFILQNYDIKGMKQVYKTFYKTIFDKCDIENIHMIFSTISEEIQKRKKDDNFINLHIEPWDLNYFVVNGMRENNFSNILDILNIIINYSIELSFSNNDNYNEILSISYSGILKNAIISEENKQKALNIIFNSIRYNLNIDDNESNDFIKYKYIFNLYKYFIDTRDKKGIEFMINSLKENINYRERVYHNIIITIVIYLYYLIEVEKPPYVNKDEKEYLKNIYQEIKSILLDSNIEFCYASNVDVLFAYINEVSHFWERFIFENGSTSCLKTPVCDKALITAKRTLLILFRKDIVNNFRNISKEDLNAFKFTVENGILKKDVLKSIQDFSEFIGFSLDNEIIDNYIDNLLEYANSNKKVIPKKNNSIEYFKNNFELIGKKLYKDTKTNNIFNCETLENTYKYYVLLPNDKEMLETYIKYDINKWIDIDNIIERKILDILSEKDFIEINYTYDTEEVIYRKIKTLKKPYYYIRPSTDNLGSEYKCGQKYLDCISKFKIINTSVCKKRFVIDNYKCCLGNIGFEIREFNDKEVLSFIKQYKKGKDYYLKDENNFDIKYTRDEMIKYCKDKYLYCALVFEIGIDIKTSKGYKFVYQKKKMSK